MPDISACGVSRAGWLKEKNTMAKITVDKEICKGCALCIGVCPKKIIEPDKVTINKKGHHPVRVIDESQCTACAFCATMCPDCAIKIEK